MTVQELIDKLLQYEPDREIFLWGDYDGVGMMGFNDELIWEDN